MGKKKFDITGVILAGGKSSRMGRNKALLEIGGKRIVESTVALFESLFSEVTLVTNTPSEYSDLGIKTVADIFPHKGPLGGIHTGLNCSSYDYSFVVSCDMPFLKRKLIEYLIGLRDGFDVVVPILRGRYEPLHALYSRGCLKPVEAIIEEGDLRIIGFYPEVRVREVHEDEFTSFNPEPSAFININTPEDYRIALGSGEMPGKNEGGSNGIYCGNGRQGRSR